MLIYLLFTSAGADVLSPGCLADQVVLVKS